MNFQIGISGDGLSEEETAQAVENIQAADIEKGITASIDETEEQPEEVTPEVVEEKEGPTAGD